MLKSNSSFKNIKITKNKEKLLSDFYKVRQQTIKLIDGLTEEDMCAQSMDDASPTKWHLAHTTWFFETFVLIPNEQKYQIFREACPKTSRDRICMDGRQSNPEKYKNAREI